MIYLLLFWEFFKIGLLSVGGGLASLPFLFDLSGKYDWYTLQELADMVAISESTPGPIGANMATYVGYVTGGIPGSVVATLGMALPSILLSLALCLVLRRFAASDWLERAFWALRPAVAGLIAAVGCSLIDLALAQNVNSGLLAGVNWPAALLFALLLPAVFYFKKHPIFYIAAGAVLGLVFQL